MAYKAVISRFRALGTLPELNTTLSKTVDVVFVLIDVNIGQYHAIHSHGVNDLGALAE